MKKLLGALWILAVSLVLFCRLASAGEDYVIDKSKSEIKGWIKYSLIGRYNAAFEDFEGVINYDPKKKTIDRVSMKVAVRSVKSGYPVLDKIVKSQRILDAAHYPYITFESRNIKHEGGVWRVKGDITLHGVTKTMEFTFDPQFGAQALSAQGVWVIERKHFDIIWNKVLDQGGIVVGNHINVEWKVTAVK